MPNKTRYVYWDSCVFLAYMKEEENRINTISSLLLEIERSAGKKKIVTSVVSITEASFATLKPGHTLSVEAMKRIDSLWANDLMIELVECHEQIARQANELMRWARQHNRALTPMDAIHLASAEWVGADEIHTYEPKWQHFAPMIGRPIVEPRVDQLAF